MKRFKRTKNHSFPSSIFFGLLINTATLLATILLFALISSYSKDPLGLIKLGAIISLYICSAISSVLISLFRKENNVLISLFSAFSLSIILLCLGLIFSRGSISIISALNYLVYCLIAFLVAKLCRGFKRKRKI